METKRSKYILAGLTVLCVLLICITSLKDGIMEPKDMPLKRTKSPNDLVRFSTCKYGVII